MNTHIIKKDIKGYATFPDKQGVLIPVTISKGRTVTYAKTDNGYTITCTYGAGVFTATLDADGNSFAGDKVIYCRSEVMRMAWKLHRAGYKFSYAIKYAWNKARESKVKALLARKEHTAFTHNTTTGVNVVKAGGSNLHKILLAHNAVPKGIRAAHPGTKPYFDLNKMGWRSFKSGTVTAISK